MTKKNNIRRRDDCGNCTAKPSRILMVVTNACELMIKTIQRQVYGLRSLPFHITSLRKTGLRLL